MGDSFSMNNRDKPRRLSTLSTVSLSQESSLLVRLESGEKNSYSSTDDEDEVIEVAAGRKGQLFLESNPNLVVELIVTFGVFVTGWYLPQKLFIPYLLGGIRERPIPYQTIASTGDVILDLNLSHPYVEQVIINDRTLIISSCWIPMLILAFAALVYPLKHYHHKVQVQVAICTVLMSIGISELTTKMIKAWVGRLRPNFYELCGFDVQTKMCMASPHHILEGRQSFPSGHSSLAFQGMVLIVLYLVGRIGLFALPMNSKSSSSSNNNNNNNNTAMKLLRTKQLQTLFAVIIPLCYGMFVATSRLVDNWHHPSDIVAGTMIGIGSASLAYHTFYPAVFSKYCGIPYACLWI